MRPSAPRLVKGVYVGATGQHVGKTTTCLGLVDGLQDRFSRLSFCKPVGQQWRDVDGVKVDKDCMLFKKHFKLQQTWDHISPVLMPKGFTRDFLDGKTTSDKLLTDIKTSFSALSAESDFVVVEGTGHTGVGSICDLNNAQVAAALGLDMVLIALGGLGSSFDELAINHAMLKQHGVKLRGVVLNQVLPEKRDMVMEYYSKALKRWDVPLLGCIPYKGELRAPSIADLAGLLGAHLLCGEGHMLRHFSSTRLAVGFYDEFTPFDPVPSQLVVTHATRTDIMAMIVRNHRAAAERGMSLNGGLIVTGASSLPANVVNALEECGVPTLAVPSIGETSMLTFTVLKKISEFTRKADDSDPTRLASAIAHVRKYTDLDAMLPEFGGPESESSASPTKAQPVPEPVWPQGAFDALHDRRAVIASDSRSSSSWVPLTGTSKARSMQYA